MDRYIGKLLDNRYEILEKIGSGGMADVYKARCHRLNRLVAIKILKEDLSQDAEFRRRFHAESQAVAMLSHPNIVSVYDVSRSDNIDYIVMELIEGITLKEYIAKKGKLSIKEASTLDAVSKTKCPILFIHGTADTFVPCSMSQAAYDVCASEKQLILVDGARHGYSYLVDRPRVQAALAAFLEKYTSQEAIQ